MARPSRAAVIKDEAKKSILLLPAVLLLLCFFIIPIVLTVYYSFTNLALSGANAKNVEFIGFENYKRMLTDPSTMTSIKNTLLFWWAAFGAECPGIFDRLFHERKTQGSAKLCGTLYPGGMGYAGDCGCPVLYGIFKDNGTMNMILGAVHIPAVSWLFKHPMMTVVIANVWHGTAFSMLNFQSALDNVSGDIEEAARVDGANRFQTLIRIIVPCIKDTIATNTMLNTLSTLGVFGLIYAMTGGGPGSSTTTLPIFMYNQGLKGLQLGYGTAIGMLILLVGAVCSVIYTRILKDQ
ncbi:MAG: carbohydrate ABC transporter permease [Blautia marasmi]